MAQARTLKLASFNIRFSGQHRKVKHEFEECPWFERRDGLADQIIWEEPDIVGFQEVLNNQCEDLTVLLGPLYGHVGAGRDDGKTAGEAVPIFWRTDRIRLLTTHHFWLSERPEVAGSIGWDAALPRLTTLCHFSFLAPSNLPTHRTDCDLRASGPLPSCESLPEDFFVLNTHYDHIGTLSRKRSSELILARLNKVMGEKGAGGAHGKLVVILGDLNSPASDDGYQVITGNRYNDSRSRSSVTQPLSSDSAPITFLDSRHALLTRTSSSDASSPVPNSCPPLLRSPFGEHFTFTGFSARVQMQLIDYILLADNGAVTVEHGSKEDAQWRVQKYGVIPNRHGDGPYVSDHRMVSVTLRKG